MIVSFGGLSGTYLAEAISDPATLKEKYATVADALDAQTVLEFAQQQNLRWLSFWELVRDNGEGSALFESSQIQQEPYEFSSIFDEFTT